MRNLIEKIVSTGCPDCGSMDVQVKQSGYRAECKDCHESWRQSDGEKYADPY